MDYIQTIMRSFKYSFFIFCLLFLSTYTKDVFKQEARIASMDTKAVKLVNAEKERQLNCLARNIYFEAGNESFEGKVAVAQVTVNRMKHNGFPSDVCKVVYQKSIVYNKTVCQFSWFCDKTIKNKPVNLSYFKECKRIANMVLYNGYKIHAVKDALYFHADYVQPNWNRVKVAKIGRHVFYK